jgi:hypothetical protein
MNSLQFRTVVENLTQTGIGDVVARNQSQRLQLSPLHLREPRDLNIAKSTHRERDSASCLIQDNRVIDILMPQLSRAVRERSQELTTDARRV